MTAKTAGAVGSAGPQKKSAAAAGRGWLRGGAGCRSTAPDFFFDPFPPRQVVVVTVMTIHKLRACLNLA